MNTNLDKCYEFFLDHRLDRDRILLTIKSTSARSIKQFRSSSDKQEYLLLPGTKVKVVRKEFDELYKILKVEIEEISMHNDGECAPRKHY